jgi:hypothetical protein
VAGQGVHIQLSREEAKRLFALQGDEAVRAFVTELENSARHRENGQVLACGTVWDPIHRCLTDGELDPEGGEFPLNHCILGGKQIYKGSDRVVSLVRPDVTPFVAESLSALKRNEFRDRYLHLDPQRYGRQPSEEEFTDVWIALQQIRDFYEVAGEERSAVLFSAKF